MKKRVRAIIIQDSSVVLVHRIKAGKEYWVFPGGGLEESDISPQVGLKRECTEELGVEVEVGEFLMDVSLHSSAGDQLESFYFCRIAGGTLGTGKGPEFSRDPEKSGTYEIQWVSIRDLNGKDVFPLEVRDRVIGSVG